MRADLSKTSMSILLSIICILIGFYVFTIGALSLRASRKMHKMPRRPSYGPGVNKHIIRTGIEIEHGIVIDKSNNLEAQSKLSDGFIESMMLK